MNTTALLSPALPRIDPPSGVRITRAGANLWRIEDDGGRPLGHLRAISLEHGWRYHVERFDPASRAFRAVGEFWTPAEAFECARYQR
ncbi:MULTISPECIES: hypothetical protein [unclassified Microbacterium]|uniref:hypothetical protein n=1 Tax=unclassified Microbacterium TaxID=2609290 RepID=UPI003747302B